MNFKMIPTLAVTVLIMLALALSTSHGATSAKGGHTAKALHNR